MPHRFFASQHDFSACFEEFLQLRNAGAQGVAGQVASVISAVRMRGDAALLEYTRQWDWPEFDMNHLRVSGDEMKRARSLCPPVLKAALKNAARRIMAYHRRQRPRDVRYTDAQGVTLGWRFTPLDAVGLYVPGGKASYPSSVLMNAIPAKVAGVHRLVMCVPAPGGELSPAVLVAAQIAGVTEIYRVGGAQAVAAMAYGTESIRPVDKIVGPGNAYVAEAKRQVFGAVGIDTIAGPSEILVLADAKNDPAHIAADLLSQAEHDVLAQSVLVTLDEGFADRVEASVREHLKRLPRADIAAQSWEKFGATFIVRDWAQAAEIANRIAPEHLELAVDDPDALLPLIRHAGAIFLGRHTPEALGDYLAGPSHVLPTAGAARFSSGLSVQDFVKRTSLIGCTPAALAALAADAEILAHAEGLQAHALSVALRRES